MLPRMGSRSQKQFDFLTAEAGLTPEQFLTGLRLERRCLHSYQNRLHPFSTSVIADIHDIARHADSE